MNSGSSSAYGMPWEILRSTKVTKDGRPIDIITKAGGLAGYSSIIAMIPEFNIGYSILVAGDYHGQVDLQERLVSVLVPAVDNISRAVVRQNYEGFYAAAELDSGLIHDEFSIKLVVDDVGPGLRVSNWTSNHTDFLSVYGRITGMPKEPSQWTARLLPTGVQYGSNAQFWRLTAIPARKAGDEKKIFDDFCINDVDNLVYNGLSVEEFVFDNGPTPNPGGQGTEFVPIRLTCTGLRAGYTKVDARPDEDHGVRNGQVVMGASPGFMSNKKR